MQNTCFPVGERDENNQEKENQHSDTDGSTQTDNKQGEVAEYRGGKRIFLR